MRDRLKLLSYYALYWLAFMVAIRIIFLAYNYNLTNQLSISEIWLVIIYGLKMDVSMSAYIVMFIALMFSISVLLTNSKIIHFIINSFSIAFLFLSCAITIVDMELYRHWGFRLNTTPFLYLGREAMGSIELSVVVKTLLVLVALFIVFLFIYLRLLAPGLSKLHKASWKAFVLMVVVTALMIIPIRGSFSVAPMNTGFVYFHKTKSYANHSAINVIWNFLNSVQRGSEIIYPEDFFDKKLALKYFDKLYSTSDTTLHLLNNKRPNVIIIILESFTAGIIKPLGGMSGIAPRLNQLCKEGILFDNFYASGDRTDKGIVSVLSGYPSQPQTSIVKFPNKTQRLPYISDYMKKLGYNPSFVYGGDIDFSNFRSYLRNCQFEHITSLDDFPDSIYTSKWGVHDEFVFNRTFLECDSAEHLFFKVVLSISSHEPFDVPMKPVVKGDDDESLFLNSCFYTDSCLGEFITAAKKRPWWKETLVIITADHGHRHPGNKELIDKERFHIPMLWLGGAVAAYDTLIHTYANQTDIANTLLSQLDQSHPEFRFSKNILGNHTKSFGVYFYNDGYGFVTSGKHIIYDNPGKQFLKFDGANKKDLDVSKAYEQVLYEDYNKR